MIGLSFWMCLVLIDFVDGLASLLDVVGFWFGGLCSCGFSVLLCTCSLLLGVVWVV